jgi:hypothetical protein
MAHFLPRGHTRWVEGSFSGAPPPKYCRSQRDISDDAVKLQVIKKLMKVREQGYIAPGFVESLTAFFGVPKGEDNIFLVYHDGSVSRLNL